MKDDAQSSCLLQGKGPLQQNMRLILILMHILSLVTELVVALPNTSLSSIVVSMQCSLNLIPQHMLPQVQIKVTG